MTREPQDRQHVHPAVLGVPIGGDRVQCTVCPFRCVLKEGQVGRCGVRANHGGALVSLTYGLAAAQAVEPIEKKPLYHFLPGADTLSVGSVGCNLRCSYCQNWEIAHMARERGRVAGIFAAPEALVQSAQDQGCEIICFTYTEPVVALEYVLDVAQAARAAGLKMAMLTGAFVSHEALAMLAPCLDAVKIDLKAPDDETYQRLTGGHLDDILTALRAFRQAGTWIEISTVVVPGLLDHEAAIQNLADLILTNAGAQTPWHLARFFPNYHLQHQAPGRLDRLRRLRALARQTGLSHVYLANVPGLAEVTTFCALCGRTLIRRPARGPVVIELDGSACPSCHSALSGVGLERTQPWSV